MAEFSSMIGPVAIGVLAGFCTGLAVAAAVLAARDDLTPRPAGGTAVPQATVTVRLTEPPAPPVTVTAAAQPPRTVTSIRRETVVVSTAVPPAPVVQTLLPATSSTLAGP